MTSQQIRVVRDALERKFKVAIGTLEANAKQFGTEAVEKVEGALRKTGKPFAARLSTAIDAVNAALKDADKNGIAFQHRRRPGSDYFDSLTDVGTDLRAALTADAAAQIREDATKDVRQRLQKLHALKERTFLSLYDSGNVRLVEIVERTSLKIDELLK